MKLTTLTLLIATSLSGSLMADTSKKAIPTKATTHKVSAPSMANKSTEAVSFTQQLDPDLDVALGVKGLSVVSKSYYQEVSGRELKQGVSLNTAGTAAVIRVTPVKTLVQGKAITPAVIEPDDLELTGASGNFNVNKSGMAIKANSDQLSNTHPGIFKNTAAFVIDEGMGKGNFALKTNRGVADNDRYLIHVFDKNSDVNLSLKTDRPAFADQDTLVVSANLAGASFKTGSNTASLISPDGRQFPMSLANGKQGVEAKIALTMDTSREPGELWKVVLNSESKEGIPRTAELAVDIHQKTASISNHKFAKGNLSVTINVNEAGRYELRGWMFSQLGKRTEPKAVQYYAKWFEPGQHQINIPIGAKNATGIVLKQLQLLDQSRLAVLETQ